MEESTTALKGSIFLIACVNLINLSTARSANRAREVGIRKVAGPTKGHQIIKFLTESILLSLSALDGDNTNKGRETVLNQFIVQ